MRSTARLFAAHTRAFLGACYSAAVVLLVAAGAFAGLEWWFAIALLPAVATLLWQVATIDIDDPAGCLRRMQLNKNTGLLVALAILIARR